MDPLRLTSALPLIGGALRHSTALLLLILCISHQVHNTTSSLLPLPQLSHSWSPKKGSEMPKKKKTQKNGAHILFLKECVGCVVFEQLKKKNKTSLHSGWLLLAQSPL